MTCNQVGTGRDFDASLDGTQASQNHNCFSCGHGLGFLAGGEFADTQMRGPLGRIAAFATFGGQDQFAWIAAWKLDVTENRM